MHITVSPKSSKKKYDSITVIDRSTFKKTWVDNRAHLDRIAEMKRSLQNLQSEVKQNTKPFQSKKRPREKSRQSHKARGLSVEGVEHSDQKVAPEDSKVKID